MNMQKVIPQKGEAQTLETSDKKPRTLGIIILVVVFGVFGLWAAFAPLDSASLAPGVVVVKGKRKTIQHYEGGMVREILVVEGEAVKKGQSLVILDSTQFSGDLGVLRGQYFIARALESRLIAERDEKDKVGFPDDLAIEDIRAVDAKQNQVEIFNARYTTRMGEKEVLEQSITQYQSQLDGLNALLKSQRELQKSFEEELKDLTALLDEGFVEKTRVVELQRNISRIQGEIADQIANIAQVKLKIGETKLQILQLNKQFKTEVVDQLAKAQAEVFDLRERIKVLDDRLERTIIRAPVTGMVLGLNATTIGGVINPGTPILDIVPEKGELIVDAKVSPADIDRVKLGQEAKIRFTAFKTKTTPTIDGVLVKISADRLVDEETGQPYYAATVVISEKGREELGDLKLLPGMPADVLIKSGERTLLQYLTQPARDVLATSLIEE